MRRSSVVLAAVLVASLVSGAWAQFGPDVPGAASYTATTVGGPTWQRPNATFTNITSTVMSFHAQDVYVFEDGEYEILSSQVDFDGFLFLYRDRFDPEDQFTNGLDGNDDFENTRTSRIVASLERGVRYIVVTTSWASVDGGAFTNVVSGPGAVALGTRDDTPAVVDSSSATRSVSVTSDVLQGRSLVNEVIVTLDFEKVGGTCVAPSASAPWNSEIYYVLTSPLGSSVRLVAAFSDPGGPTYTSSTVFGGRVLVTLDDGAEVRVGGPAPVSGHFRPWLPMSAFQGEGAAGEWTLTVGDALSFDELCHYGFSLAVQAVSEPSAPVVSVTSGLRSLGVVIDELADDGGSPVTFEYSLDDGAWIAFDPPLVDGAGVITGLDDGTAYSVRVRAVNPVLAGEASDAVVGSTFDVPSAPRFPSAVEGARAVTMLFGSPSDDGGSPVTAYEYSLDGGAWVAFGGAAGVTSAVIDGLEPGVTYQVRLRARNAVGAGAPSDAISVTTLVGTPSAPRNLAVVVADGAVVVSFDAPEDDGGSAITNYEVSVDDGSWVALDPPVTGGPLVVPDLDGSVAVSVRLRAVNANGAGEASEPVTVDGSAPVVGPPSVSITFDLPEEPESGSVTFSLTLTNTGDETLPELFFSTSELPEGVVVDEVTASQGSFDVDALHWSELDLEAGASASLSITVTIGGQE